jgi:hypothetical protein
MSCPRPTQMWDRFKLDARDAIVTGGGVLGKMEHFERKENFNVPWSPRLQPGDEEAIENLARYIV